MAADTSFNYSNLLDLKKAKLVKRSRLNFLGTKELTFAYQLQVAGIKEEAMEWLEENRLTLTNPNTKFRTYTGVWKSIEIEYDEKTNTISQRFKIDSVFTNDVSARNNGGLNFKSYYWRIVNPGTYNIPAYDTTQTQGAPDLDGFFWYDSHTDLNSKNIYHASDDLHQLWYDGSNYIINLIADGVVTTNSASSSTIEGDYTGTGTWAGGTPTDITVGFTNTDDWNKTVNDNGDGTYDVVISRNSTNTAGQSGTGAVMSGAETNTQNPDTDIIITGATFDTGANGTYVRWQYASTQAGGTAYVDVNTHEWYDTDIWVNEKVVSYDEDDAVALWHDGSNYIISVVADVGGSPTDYAYSLSDVGVYTSVGDWLTDSVVITVAAAHNGYPFWSKGTRDAATEYAIKFNSTTYNPPWYGSTDISGWDIIEDPAGGATKHYGCSYFLSRDVMSSATPSIVYYGWAQMTGSVPSPPTPPIEPSFTIVIGQSGPSFREASTVTINSAEQKFVTDGGSVADPIGGEIKTIQNIPLANGKFKTTVVIKTGISQRMPGLYDMYNYNNGAGTTPPSINHLSGVLIGKNRTATELAQDLGILSSGPVAGIVAPNALSTANRAANSNSISLTMNQYGRYDYTLNSQYRV